MSAIYLHIPFCKSICAYCDFFRTRKLEMLPQVIGAMKEELCAQRDFITDKRIKTIYFGGGTPSLLTSEQVGDFLSLIGELYDLSELEEVTLEANPDDLTPEYLAALRGVGVNRLSIGVQSFDDDELRFMNRRHSSAQAAGAVRAARAAGFDNIAIDLIFGVDGFGGEVLQRSIDIAVSLGVEHIAAYHLTIEHGTPMWRRVERGEQREVAEECSLSEYMLLHNNLSQAGYEHYEISNYAKPARRSRHNSSYWQGVEYLGIGAGAHSFNGRQRRWAVDSIERYLKGGEQRYEGEEIDKTKSCNETIMTSLRCVEGVDILRFEELYGTERREALERASQVWIRGGELVLKGGRLYIPSEHFMLSDMVIESLFD